MVVDRKVVVAVVVVGRRLLAPILVPEAVAVGILHGTLTSVVDSHTPILLVFNKLVQLFLLLSFAITIGL